MSTAPAETGYGRGAAVLSVGIGVTGLITYAYFGLASHSLSEADYGGITLLWSAVFVTVSVLYRPVEQLLSRTIADRGARGATGDSHLRVAATIQLALGVLFAVVALALRDPLEDDLFGGSQTLYWVLIVTVLAYAVSYFARGFLAGIFCGTFRWLRARWGSPLGCPRSRTKSPPSAPPSIASFSG